MRVAAMTLLGLGAGLMLLAGLGVLRLPDVFARMHAGTKAASLGLVFILVGTGLLLPTPLSWVKITVAIAFQLLTAPIAAHVIGRAAYYGDVPLWGGTLYDELAPHERGLGQAPEPTDD